MNPMLNPKTLRFRLVPVMASLFLLIFSLTTSPASKSEPINAPAGKALYRMEPNRPLVFEANHGQIDVDGVAFLARAAGYRLLLEAAGVVFLLPEHQNTIAQQEKQEVLSWHAARMTFSGGNPGAKITGLDPLQGKINYYIGNDPAKWRTGIPTYARVQCKEVYPGVDLVYYGDQGQLEFDLVIGPEDDPAKVVLAFEGVEELEVDAGGDLVLHLAESEIRLRKPHIYQDLNGTKQPVSGGYVLEDARRVRFEVADYEKVLPLIIDPMVVVYSTYFGGDSADAALGIAVDDVYVTGTSFDENTWRDFATIKIDASGSQQWVARLDGSARTQEVASEANSLAVDDAGNVYVTGNSMGLNASTDYVTVKYDSNGTEMWRARFIAVEGSFNNRRKPILAVDASGNVVITGQALGSDTGLDYATIKYDAAGARQWIARYDGPTNFDDLPTALAVDAAGNVYVTGSSMPDLANLDYATIKYSSSGDMQWIVRYRRSLSIRSQPQKIFLSREAVGKCAPDMAL